MLFMCCLVTISEVETEFERGSSDRKKCVILILEFNEKHLETQVVLSIV